MPMHQEDDVVMEAGEEASTLEMSSLHPVPEGATGGELDEEPETAALVEDEEGPTDTAAAAAQPARGMMPWLGGTGIGAAAASVVWGGLWLTGLLGSGETPRPGPAGPAAGRQPLPADAPAVRAAAPEAPSVDSALSHLRSGDFDKALPIFDAAPANDPAALAARGEARWLKYLREKRSRNEAPKADEPDVEKAKQELAEAKSAQAAFWLGQIEETLGKPAEARALYEKGLKEHPEHKKLFQAALDRLDLAASEGAAQSRAPLPPDRAEALAALALLLTALQNPPAADDDEAGFEFWNALKLAKAQDFDKAIAALKTARALHEQRRFLHLRKSQNPLSDPNEEIFLRSCEEIQKALELRSGLARAGYKDPNPLKALGALVTAARKAADTSPPVTAKGKAPDATPPPVADKGKDETLADALKAKETADRQLAAVKNELASTRFLGDGQQDLVKGVQELVQDWRKQTAAPKDTDDRVTKAKKRLAEAKVADNDLAKGVDQLAGQRDDLSQTLQEVAKKLRDARLLAAEGNDAELLKALDKALQEKPQREVARPTNQAPVREPSPEPLPAEDAGKHFAAGLLLYRLGQYAEAERELAQAAHAQEPDARHYYFLGLAQLGQGGRQADASQSFRRAAQLERQEKPGRAVVNASLERIQGTARQTLNQFRP
jgi:tetratricopeptide (TPR) repeat protein